MCVCLNEWDEKRCALAVRLSVKARGKAVDVGCQSAVRMCSVSVALLFSAIEPTEFSFSSLLNCIRVTSPSDTRSQTEQSRAQHTVLTQWELGTHE